MIKLLAKNYYTFVVIVAGYFIFNLLLRDRLINWLFNTSKDQSVIDAEAYAREELLRNLFSLVLLILMIAISIISIVLLNNKEGRSISRTHLVVVPTSVAFCLLLAMLAGSFS